MMKRYIILVISLLLSISVYAQKYKDVYESIKNLPENEAYQVLQEYSRQKNNSHPASLYKMALILEHRFDTYDPFLQSDLLRQSIYDAELFMQLARLNLNEKNAKQDDRFFDGVKSANPKKDPTFQEIADAIDAHQKKIKEFKEIFLENHDNLYNAATKYNECIRIYNEINQKNSKLKDLYFMVDDKFKSQLDELKTNFDSTLYFLGKLQKSLKKHPMLSYKFEYHLNPILVYRMHGLTPANFLAPTIELWDYKQWIETFNDVYKKEIDFLYTNIDETDTKNKKYVAQLSERNIDGIPADYQVPPVLINKIYKYDYESLANSLLIFQEAQIRYAYQLASYQPDTNFFAMGVNYPASDYFMNSISKRRTADSLLVLFSRGISKEGIKKYSALFEKKYKGEKNLRKYIQEQQTFNSEFFISSIDDYANRLLTMTEWNTTDTHSMLYNGDTVFAQIITSGNLPKQGYFIHNEQIVDKNLILVSGSYLDKKGDQSGFVASVDTLHNINWLKTFKQGEGKRTCMFVSAVNDEVATIVTSTSKAGNIRNFMVLLDKDGNQKQSVEVKVKALPRKLMVDDIDNKYIVLFCGTKPQQFVNESCEMHVCGLDSKFKTLWDKQLKFDGYTCNMIKTDDVYYIFGAFSKMHSLDDEDIDLNGNSGLFVYSIDNSGNWLNGNNYEASHSIYPMWISKCDNTTFEVVSALDNEPRPAAAKTDEDELEPIKGAYMRFTFDCKEVFSSVEK